MKTEKGVLSSQRAGNLFFVMTVVQIAGSLAYGIAGLFFPQLYGIAVSTVFSEGLALVPMLISAVCSGVAAGKLFPFCRIRPIQILQALLLTAAVYPVCIFLNGLSLYFTENAVEQMSGAIVDRPMWEMILLIGIAGPFCEEIIFRGFFFQNLKKGNGVIGAAVFSGILFGLFHMNFNQFVYAAAMGIFLALADEAGGSLWISVLMHQMFNTAEVAAMYQAEPWPLETAETEAAALSEAAEGTALAWGAELIPAAILAAAGVALFFVILRWMRSSSRKNVPETQCRMGTVQMEDGNTAGKRRFSVWGWIGVVISAGYMIVMDFFVMVL